MGGNDEGGDCEADRAEHNDTGRRLRNWTACQRRSDYHNARRQWPNHTTTRTAPATSRQTFLRLVSYSRFYTIRYDTIEEINVDSKAEYTA